MIGRPGVGRTTVAAAALASLVALAGCGGGGSGDHAAAGGATSTAPPVPITAPPPTTTPPTTTPPTTLPAAFASSVTPVSAADLGASWHDGCPVGPDQLRRITLSYWGFDDAPHTGAIVVHVDVVDAVTGVFRQLYSQRFPIRSVQTIDKYNGSDDASMAADNTSGFNCRFAVTTGPQQWSVHAYGQAIDVNPVENPYLEGGQVLPPAGSAFVDRANVRPGMAGSGTPVNDAFAGAGWQWGGRWAGSPDYQHFSAFGG